MHVKGQGEAVSVRGTGRALSMDRFGVNPGEETAKAGYFSGNRRRGKPSGGRGHPSGFGDQPLSVRERRGISVCGGEPERPYAMYGSDSGAPS